MWNVGLPWWEFVLRGAILYVSLLVILRVTGKRNTGQLALCSISCFFLFSATRFKIR